MNSPINLRKKAERKNMTLVTSGYKSLGGTDANVIGT